MVLLEELTPGTMIKGLLPGCIVTLIAVKQHGDIGVELVYKDSGGKLSSELLYSESVAQLEIASDGLPWNFDADGALFRLVSEAYRIRLAYRLYTICERKGWAQEALAYNMLVTSWSDIGTRARQIVSAPQQATLI